LPGHSESVTAAAGIDADIAGVHVLGLGEGSGRPTFTVSTATTADIDIDAANITFENMIFDLTGIDAVAGGIDVNAAGFTLKKSEVVLSDGSGPYCRRLSIQRFCGCWPCCWYPNYRLRSSCDQK
jgi:hypothetical protein